MENLTIRELQEFAEIEEKDLTASEFKRRLKKLAEKHNLTDLQIVDAHKKARGMLGNPKNWV